MTAAATASRPAPTRERLLRSGFVVARRGGLRKLTVRAVVTHARANLGSFVYHFGSRDAFNAELMERWYAPLWAELQPTTDTALAPLERYRQQVRCLADWAAAHRELIGQLLLDAAAHEPAALGFLRSVSNRHPALMMATIAEAQRDGALVAGEPLELLMFTMGSVALPVVLTQGIASRRLLPREAIAPLAASVAAPERIAQRLQWAIAGISACASGVGRRAP